MGERGEKRRVKRRGENRGRGGYGGKGRKEEEMVNIWRM